MAILWNMTMSIGIDKVDAQHKKLIDMLNVLGEAMQAGKGKEEIGRMLTFAGEYAQEHFRCEEEYFDQYHCPESKQNREGHAYFVKRFTELMVEFRAQGPSFSLMMKIYNELSEWLVQHILGVDVKLRDCIKEE